MVSGVSDNCKHAVECRTSACARINLDPCGLVKLHAFRAPCKKRSRGKEKEEGRKEIDRRCHPNNVNSAFFDRRMMLSFRNEFFFFFYLLLSFFSLREDDFFFEDVDETQHFERMLFKGFDCATRERERDFSEIRNVYIWVFKGRVIFLFFFFECGRIVIV